MSVRNIVLIVIVVLFFGLALDAFFVVDERQRAITLRFGEAHKFDLEPGFHLKLPIADQVKYFDGRILTIDTPPEQFFTIGQRPVDVDSYVKWRIFDPRKYYTVTAGEETVAIQIIQNRVNEGLRNQIARRDMHEVVSGERDQLMQELTSQLDQEIVEELGIHIVDIRVKQIDLPPDVTSNVFERMNSDRQIISAQRRATGTEQAAIIRADADRQVQEIAADAYRDAQVIRGNGDAEATKIYADAYGKDPEFYEFYQSINAYVNIVNESPTMIILDPSSEFFKYLKDKTGG